MKKMLVRGLLATTLFACGGGMDTTSVEAGGEETEVTSNPMPEEALVAEVQWKGETIQFINTAEPGETPAILISRVGDVAGGDIYYQFQKQAQYTISAAELWRAVTGREDVPELLVLDHQDAAEQQGRPLDYQNFDPDSVEKAPFSFSAMFPFPSGTTTSVCYGNAVVISKFVDRGVTGYICSSDHSDTLTQQRINFSDVTRSTACPTSLNTKEAIRAGFYSAITNITNSTQPTVLSQLCFDGGSSGWVCQSPLQVTREQYRMAEYAKSSSTHRFAVSVNTPLSAAISAGVMFGSAHLKPGVPQFQSTLCGAGQ